MSNLDRIVQIKQRIKEREKLIRELGDKMIKLNAPKGYKKSTSYNDYDTIRGGQRGMEFEEYCKDLNRLQKLNELDKLILDRLTKEVDEEEYLELLDREEQVKFLREIQGYSQEKTAEKIGICTKTVARIEKRLN